MRNVDIRPRILDPQHGSNIPNGTPLQLTLSYRNAGPDTLLENDSIRVALFVDNALIWAVQSPSNPVQDSFISYESGIRLAPGDSVIRTYPPMSIVGLNGSHSICIQTYTRGALLRDPVTANNRSCATVIFGPMNVKTAEETKVLLYPQPVHSEIRWTLPAGKTIAQLMLYDLTGKQILKEVPAGNSLSVAALPEGFYVIQMAFADGQRWRQLIQIKHL